MIPRGKGYPMTGPTDLCGEWTPQTAAQINEAKASSDPPAAEA